MKGRSMTVQARQTGTPDRTSGFPSRSAATLWALLLCCLAGPTGCDGSSFVAETSSGVVARAPSYEARLDLALTRTRSSRLGTEAVKDLEAREGEVAVDEPSSVSGWPQDTQVRALLEDASLKALLLEPDEEAAAKALTDAGVRVVALHWRLASSIDRDRRVLSRLYHHDELHWFKLFRITDELLLYQIIPQPMFFPPSLAYQSIQVIRSLIKGQQPEAVPNVQTRYGAWNLMASVRGQGRELAIGLARSKDYRHVLAELASDLERGHRRYVEWYGLPRLSESIDDLSVEIHLVTELAAVEPRGEDDLEDLWELGIDGAIIRDYEAGKGAVFPGALSYTRSYRDVDTFLRRAATFHHLNDKRPWRKPEVSLEMVRSQHYLQTPDNELVYLYRGVPPVPMESVTLDRIRSSVLSAADWYLENLLPDGRVRYKWWPAENRESNEYNLVRHTLATWNLVEAWKLDPRPEFLEGARSALDYTLKWVKDEGDMSFISFNDNQKLGSVVVGLLGMIDLAQVTEDHQWDDLMRRFGRFVEFMQEPDGRFRGYHVSEDHPYYNQVNDIVPGEAALALIYLSNYFNDPGYLEPLPRYWAYYQPWFRERAARKRPDAPWPAFTYDNDTRLALVQFGPWSIIAANAYQEATGDQQVADFGLEVARWMIDTYEWTSDKAPFPDYVGGYYKIPGELPAMQAFCYAEGTAAAYQLALRAAPEQASFFEEHTRESMRFAMQMQFNDFSVYPFSRPEIVKGGIRYAMNETKVRIDYVHHALSAMNIYLGAARNDPNLPQQLRGGKAPAASQPDQDGTAADQQRSPDKKTQPGRQAPRGKSHRPEPDSP